MWGMARVGKKKKEREVGKIRGSRQRWSGKGGVIGRRGGKKAGTLIRERIGRNIDTLKGEGGGGRVVKRRDDRITGRSGRRDGTNV